MSEEQDAPPPPEEAPPPPRGASPPGAEDHAPPGPGEPAPPPPGDEALPPGGEEDVQAKTPEETPSFPEKWPSSLESDILNLIPSSEIMFPEDDEEETQRVRSRPAPRTVQSMLSQALSQSSHRSSKYLRSMSGIPNLQETLKERQVLLVIPKRPFYFKFKHIVSSSL